MEVREELVSVTTRRKYIVRMKRKKKEFLGFTPGIVVQSVRAPVVVDEGVFSESVYEEEEYEEEALLIWFFTEMNTQSTNIIKLIFLVESTSLSLDI